MEQRKVIANTTTPRFGTDKKDKKIDFGKLLKKNIKKLSKSLSIKKRRHRKKKNDSIKIKKKRHINSPSPKKPSLDINNFSNLLKKKFHIRDDFDESHTQEILHEKEIAFEKPILSDETFEQF